MHYIPSTLRPSPNRAAASSAEAAASASAVAAPVYLLTTLVGLLLGADFLLGFSPGDGWGAYRILFGYRLALLAAVLGGARILYHTLEGLFEGRVGADLALTIACLAAIILGEAEVAALVVFIALCGETIEGLVAGRAQRALTELFNLRPRIAHVLRANQEVDVAIEDLTVGELVVVRPGERLPADGTVLEGSSAVDQSPLTGESWPVDKQPGDAVFSGTLNQFGTLTFSVDTVGEETTLGQIVRLVAEATARKTPLERTADRLARLFLPAVLLAAGLTLVGWRLAAGNWQAGWMPALAVLVVACPCPLILATPSAVLAAMAWLARKGVVVKGSVALERLAHVDTFVFDKTGTLTQGRLSLGDIYLLAAGDENELLRIAAAVERPSEHVLGRLIANKAAERRLAIPDVRDFAAHPGAGVTGWILRPAAGDVAELSPVDDATAWQKVAVGTSRLLQAENVEIPATVGPLLARLDEAGQTPVLVALDGTVLGLFGVLDAVRPEAPCVLAELRAAGITRFALLTGDRLAPARRVLQMVGPLDDVRGEMLPQQKAEWIESQTQAGRRVAMVGDGINDAPALAAAGVGLALGAAGSPIAAEAGDIILMGDPLAPLPGLLRLSRELVRVIRLSIYLFAFGLNGLGVLLSAWGVLNPVAAAIFHEGASLAVMLHALRLLYFERWHETPWGRGLQGLLAGSDRLVEALSPSRCAVWIWQRGAVLVRLGVAAAALAWCFSNLVLVEPDEEALVTRFGRDEAVLPPGVHFRWPRPFEQVRREKRDRIRTVQIGFRADQVTEVRDGSFLPAIEWQADHHELGYEPVAAEALMLSGEEVPVEITAELSYRLASLQDYLYGTARPEELLRATSERAVRQVAARLPLDEILTARRSQIEQECLSLIRTQIREYRMGVELTGFQLLDIHPPTAVVPYYRQVADALEEQEQLVNEGQRTYARELLTVAGAPAVELLESTAAGIPAEGERGSRPAWVLDAGLWQRLTDAAGGTPLLSGSAAARLHHAEQQRSQSVQQALGETARFAARYQAYRAAPELTTWQMYWDAVERGLAAVSLTIVDPHAAGRRHLFLGEEAPAALPAPAALETPLPPAEDHQDRRKEE